MKFLVILMMVSLFVTSVFAANLENKYPSSEGVFPVKGKAQKLAIQKILQNVDVAFEMGDGYYDVVSTKLFIVRNEPKVQGYIELYKLSFTEDPEYVFVVVRYDVKGQRVGELEELGREPK